MIRSNTHVGSTRLLALAVLPMLAASFGCTGTVSGPTDEGVGGGTSVGPGGNSPTAGRPTNGGASQGGSPVSGGSGSGGSKATAGAPNAGGGSMKPPPAPDQPLPVDMEGAPIYSRFHRLTNDQYENSVRTILKLSTATGLADNFLHAVSGVTDFTNNERVVIVNDAVWKDFQSAAETVAAQVTATDAALQAVVATTDVATFVKSFGRRAFRRDLGPDEVTTYTALHTEGAAYAGTQTAFTKGAALVIAAMLQSPHFLYRTEMADKGAPLSGYEMAAKLSLWILDTTPTDAILDAAKGGSFDAAEMAAAQAEAMLADPAAKAVMRKFHNELYKFDLYDHIAKDNVAGYTTDLNPEFKEASFMFFDRVFSQNLGVKEMLTTNVGFAGPNMAKLYGMSVNGSGLQQVTLADRTGYYSQAPFLTLWAINNDPDSIHRGVRINLDTLCAVPGLPAEQLPPVPPLEANQTNRERYTNLTAGCGGACHGQIINPIGFAFENFDGVGRARDMDHGKPVDTTGTYPFAEGLKSFTGAADLMQLMASGKQAHQCYAKRIASYALGRDLVETDRPLVEALGAASLEGGASVKGVMLALIRDDKFRTHVGGAP